MQDTNAAYIPNRLKRLEMSVHARKRSAQRAIGMDDVALIGAFGERTYDGHGGIRCLMTRDAIKRLSRTVGHTPRIEALLGKYVVLSAEDEATVITVGHKYS